MPFDGYHRLMTNCKYGFDWWGVNYLQYYILKTDRSTKCKQNSIVKMQYRVLEVVCSPSSILIFNPCTCFTHSLALTIPMTYLLSRRHNLNSHWTISETSKIQCKITNTTKKKHGYKWHWELYDTERCLKKCSFIHLSSWRNWRALCKA